MSSPSTNRPSGVPTAAPSQEDRKRITLLVMDMLDRYREQGAAPPVIWRRRFDLAREKARSLHPPDSRAFTGLEAHVDGRPAAWIAAATLALFAYYRLERAFTFGACFTAACEVCRVDPDWPPPSTPASPDREASEDETDGKEPHARNESTATLWHPHQ